MKTIPLTKKDFLWTKWNPADIDRAAKWIVAEKKARYAEIKKIPASERTFENTIYAAEASSYGLSDKAGYIHTLSLVSPDKKIRNAARKAEKEISKKMVDIEYDEKLYKAVREYVKNQKKLKEKLTEDDKKLLKDILLGYKRMGFELPKEDQKELKQILKRESKLSNDFEKNINEYKDYILVTRDELDGLSERYIDGLTKDKKSRKYKVTLEYPDMLPFMVNAKNEDKRRELDIKELQKGGKQNIKILEEVLFLRNKSARLLGHKHFGDYNTEERMAKSAQKVENFTSSLMKKVEKGALAELQDLTNLKIKDTGKKCKVLKHHDIAYYSNILKKERFNIDSEMIREYFPLDHVKKEMFKIFGALFGVKFERLNGYSFWHKDVEFYAVKEKGKIISYFIFDLFPRDGKYGHACVQDVAHSRLKAFLGAERIAPYACLITNFPKLTKKYPSLLSHGDVQTLFHEFGHILHHCLSKSIYASQSGFNVAWDFVEAPSQILENWAWDEKILKKLSKHYKTQKPLPKSIMKNMKKIKMHMVKYSILRQLILGLFDMKLHTVKVESTTNLYNKLVQIHTGIKMPKGNIFPARFGHLMGYGAGYYSYMWALVFSDDMFSKFKKNGVMNKKTGSEFKKWILEKGASQDEMKLVEKFLKRKPNNEAFLKEIGLRACP